MIAVGFGVVVADMFGVLGGRLGREGRIFRALEPGSKRDGGAASSEVGRAPPSRWTNHAAQVASRYAGCAGGGLVAG